MAAQGLFQYRETEKVVSSSSEDSDNDISDNEDKIWKKARRKASFTEHQQTFTNPVLAMKETQNSSQSLVNTAERKPRKKVNNIWGNVLLEQTITQELGGHSMESFERSRDVESYDYKRFREEKLSGDNESNDEDEEEDMFGDSTSRNATSEKEDDMEDQESKERSWRKRSVKDRIGPRKTVHGRLGEDSTSYEGSCSSSRCSNREDHHKRSRNTVDKYEIANHGGSENKNVKERLGSKPFSEDYIHVTEEDTEEKVVAALSENLNEPKVELLERIVNILGTKKAVEFMHATENIEEAGGIMVLNGSRRRTPGGVFFHLIKSDKNISSETSKKIFTEDQREEQRKIAKARRKKYRQKKVMKLSKLQSEISPPKTKMDFFQDEAGSIDITDNLKTDPVNIQPNARDVAMDGTETMECKSKPEADLEEGELEEGEILD